MVCVDESTGCCRVERFCSFNTLVLLSAAEMERVWRWEVSLLFSSIRSIGESCRDGAFERSVGVNNAIGCRGIFNWLKLEAMNVGGIGCATGALVIGGEGADISASIGW